MEEDKQKSVQVFNVKPSLVATKKLAGQLTKFIDDNHLSSNIAGKKYIQVEGWQFAGSQLGLSAVVVSIDDISTETAIKYKATVEVVHNATGQIVSRGFAICSKKESKKASFDEYAIASMAQTRAIGKAYRNILAWLVRMAGFEGTPSEEIGDSTREDLRAELAEKKADVFAAFKTHNITDSQDMLNHIGVAIDKQSITTADEADLVLAYLEGLDEIPAIQS